ncbi:MAG: hypothetical protein JXR76_12370 [Deltaproteobacteria bacterium]|nr:hypothetical protein [Deltaproteobacteria bacterium]
MTVNGPTISPRISRDLLLKAIQESIPPVPAQFDDVDWKFVYIPDRHTRALEPDVMLVSGIRGAGKTFWWHLLQRDEYRKILLPNASVSVGFGQGSSAAWPDQDELQRLLEKKRKPRLIWKAVILRQITPQAVEFVNWDQFVDWVVENPSAVASHFREFDDEKRRSNESHIVLFDALERTADKRTDREALLSGLLQIVLELRSFKALRAKVYARPDMLDAPEVKSFPDASKVLASVAKLEWRTVDLYGLLFRYLGNANDDSAANAFRQLVKNNVSGSDADNHGGWEVPHGLRGDESLQRAVFEAIAGPYMGTNRRKGLTYTWVPNHLSDAIEAVSPRSFLAAIRKAADESTSHDFALHWKGIQEGVRYASGIRVDEIQEDLSWAHEAMTLLKDLVVPCPREKIISAWKQGGLLEKTLIGLPEDTENAMRELRQVGIFKELSDGRINIPDIYRLGFGLRRKGGFIPRR